MNTQSRLLLFAVLMFANLSASRIDAYEFKAKVSSYSLFAIERHEFSRSRFISEGTFTHPLSDHFNIEVSARGFIDPAIWSASYPKPVVRDERYEITPRTAFIEFSALPVKLRLGMQQIVWGEALHYLSADLLHPKDYRDFFINDLSWARVAQTGIWLSYDADGTNAQFVYFPFSKVHRLPRYQSEFYLKNYGAEQFGIFNLPTESQYDFGKPTLGVNLGKRIDDFDIHLMAVLSKDFQKHLNGFEYQYGQILTTAATASLTYYDFIFRAEAINIFNRKLNSLTLSATVGDETITQIQMIPSVEYNLTEDIMFNTQAYYHQNLNCPSNLIEDCAVFQQAFGLHFVRLPFKLDLDTTAWIEYKDPSVWWSTKVKRAFGDHLTVIVGVEQFMGEGQTTYSELANRDQISSWIEYAF